jgi:hypothetical protein
MADPISQSPWLAFLDWLEKVIKENWSGLAVLLYGYEEKKIDAAKQEQKTAELKEKLAEDENAIREAVSCKSDDDIISDSIGINKPKP